MSLDLIPELPSSPPSPCALAIGNFDGVHTGHRVLLKNMMDFAALHNLVPAVLTFDPHPAAIVAPERRPQLICSVDERIELLRQAGVRRIAVLPFTLELSRQTPREFVERYLARGLSAKAVFVGESFRFGHRQSGDAVTLRQLGGELGFDTNFLPPVAVRGEVVSSSAIRRHIQSGHVSAAARLLGRCFSTRGPVVSGQGVGSKRTVPTLNLLPVPGLILPHGVFISETIDHSAERNWASITNVGHRPTFDGGNVTIETFLLDALNGESPREIEVRFRRYVRPEIKFESPDALKAQILKDAGQAQRYWRRLRRAQNFFVVR